MGRLDSIQEHMRDIGVDAVVVTTPANLRYLLGDAVVGAATVTGEEVAVFAPAVDFPGLKESLDWAVYPYSSEEDFFHQIGDYIRRWGPRTVAVEMRGLDALTFHLFDHHLFRDIMLRDASGLFARMRQSKDGDELFHIRRAAEIADAGMTAAFDTLEPGVTEAELAGEAEYAMRVQGGESWAQYTSISTGPGAAHGGSSSREIKWGDVVVIRLAPSVSGYAAILARTTVVGEPTEDQQKAYDIYLRAQRSTAGVLWAGTKLWQAEETMARWLGEYGYGESYPLPLIHGVGLDPVEAPIVSGHGYVRGLEVTDDVVEDAVLAVGGSPLVLPDYAIWVEDTVWVGPEGPVDLTKFDHHVF